jgi:hypothetical protein
MNPRFPGPEERGEEEEEREEERERERGEKKGEFQEVATLPRKPPKRLETRPLNGSVRP